MILRDVIRLSNNDVWWNNVREFRKVCLQRLVREEMNHYRCVRLGVLCYSSSNCLVFYSFHSFLVSLYCVFILLSSIFSIITFLSYKKNSHTVFIFSKIKSICRIPPCLSQNISTNSHCSYLSLLASFESYLYFSIVMFFEEI